MAGESSQSGQVPPARPIDLVSLSPQSPGRLSPQEQLEAVRRLQEQAEKRLRLGRELFQAAEGLIRHYRQELEQLKQQQQELLQQMQKEIASSLRQYDQWIGQMEKDTTRRLEELTRRLAAMEAAWPELQKKVEMLLKRSGAVLEQIRSWMVHKSVRESDQRVPQTETSEPRTSGGGVVGTGSVQARLSEAESCPASSSATSGEADFQLPPTLFTDLLKQIEQVRIDLSPVQRDEESLSSEASTDPRGQEGSS